MTTLEAAVVLRQPIESPMQAAVDAVLDQALREQRLVGAVVLVQHRGRFVYRNAAGWADREARRPMRADTLFRLASVTKPIVTAAAMVLVSQGRLDLDAPVTRWLPAFRPALADASVPTMTLRHLLSHSAGLGYRFLDSETDGPHARAGVSDGMDASNLSLAENVRRIATVPLHYSPGEGWCYSLAVDVVGAVLEAACGQPLDAIVRDLVCAPLGMSDTAFHAVDPARLAVPYVSDTPAPHALREGEVAAAFPDTAGIIYNPARALDRSAFPSGGAGMVGVADDVMTLLEVLRRGGDPLFDATWAGEMGRIQTGDYGPPDEPGWGFGLGFSVLRDPSLTATPEAPGTWRWGGAYGHSWFVDGALELSVVAFTNTLYEGMSGPFVTELRDAVYAGLAKEIAA
ncbi:CubicO group peptidase, beta-lactamase class C family [Dyella sp. OK004]|uniref:serine hydrolase domain-containing protein n=1 Tax=Dyella sp. OK004 TaxID=1855292 RepID=UPI0008E40B74|nr:serine hydrolase domain-containing protein [Dyella sp. OK004]SFR94811.1 CubicO group peptidase, beta-lactamase class C family [Dyella sp. OK004]